MESPKSPVEGTVQASSDFMAAIVQASHVDDHFIDLSPEVAREKIAEEKQRYNLLTKKHDTLTSEHLAVLEELEGYKKRWSTAVSARFENEGVLQSEISRLSVEAQQKNELKKKLKHCEAELMTTRREMECVSKAKDEVEKRADKLDEFLTQINSLNDTAVQTLRVQLDDSRSRLRRVEGEVTKERDVLKKQLDIAKNILKELQGKRKQEEDSANSIHAEAKKFLNEEASLRFQIAVHEQEADRYKADIAGLERTVEDMSSHSAALEENLTERNQAIAQLKDMLNQGQREIRALKAHQTSMVQALNTERAGRLATEGWAAELEEKVARLKGRCAGGEEVADFVLKSPPRGATVNPALFSIPGAEASSRPGSLRRRGQDYMAGLPSGAPRLWQTSSAVLMSLALLPLGEMIMSH